MPNIVLAGALLTAGLRSDFATAYDQSYRVMYDRWSLIADLEKPSDKRTEIYGYWTAAPYPQRWPRGTPIPMEAFDSVQFSTTNLKWGKGTAYEREDEEDAQIAGFMARVRGLGTNFGTLDERVITQMIVGNTDPDLLPIIPNCPDGAALYATTAGGVNRFGISNGNVEAAAALTPQAQRSAVYRAVMRIARFKDTKGQPLWNEDMVKGSIVLLYGLHNDELMQIAFANNLMAQAVTNIGASENVAAAAVENSIKTGRLNIRLMPTQRITDDKVRVFATSAPHKAFFVQHRRPLEEWIELPGTSDTARRTDQGSAFYNCRKGYGQFLPYQTAIVDN